MISRYYCPFCSSHYQIFKTSIDGRFICGKCGDPLKKKSLINSRQILGLVAASAFMTPLLIMIIFVINDFTKVKPQNNLESLVLLTFM